MCKWGTTEEVRVRIPADLSCTGKSYLKKMQIDKCMAPIVKVLQEGGINMRSSCCGHGKALSEISLQDGRVLVIINRKSYLINKYKIFDLIHLT